MSMTKQDFITLADVLYELREDILNNPPATAQIRQGRLEQWQNTQNALADFCQSQNPRFMRDRWLSYIAGECGSNGGSVLKGKVA